ncbi:Hypothetical protein ADU71_1170 [Pediococcus damnosus]|uniref:hypothetical protein n=1 Tax=Pediococcus damnosus TaxID=51663 RepID=UPI00078E6D5F|nr:hypothetical protein [Pediococcus damnosus]AMV65068.1 Hypothetical protein ADU71_1170 [Pediococcus damnosus]
MKTFLGIIIILISIGIIYLGIRYIRDNKKTYAKAGVKVDFKKTPVANGFAPGLIGTMMILVGICDLVWGVVVL